jgi:hypothetical protein
MPDTLSIRTATVSADPHQGRQTPDDSPTGFSVADLCARWRIGSDKVHAFRRSGELVGVNLAANMSIRPLWRFTRQEVERFEQRRSSAPAAKPTRRRRQPAIVDYFPGD